MFWIAVPRPAGAYDAGLFGNCSDEFRKVLPAGVGLTAAVGHELTVADLASELKREKQHGLAVVGAARRGESEGLAGTRVCDGIDDVTNAWRMPL